MAVVGNMWCNEDKWNVSLSGREKVNKVFRYFLHPVKWFRIVVWCTCAHYILKTNIVIQCPYCLGNYRVFIDTIYD